MTRTSKPLPVSITASALSVAVAVTLTIAVTWLPIVSEAKDRQTLAAEGPARTLRGITAPHRTAVVNAERPNQITHIAVAEGQYVREGDLLVSLQDDVQRIRTEMAGADAKSMLRIDLARTKIQRAQNDLEHYTRLSITNNASNRELTEAKLAAEFARLEHEVARFEHRQLAREYDRQRQLLDQLSIRAPFGGYVAKVHKQAGETVDELDGLITLVELDPLDVWLDCPVHLAGAVRPGDQVSVRPVDSQWSPRVGEVTLTHRVADPASQTFKIKITVGNKGAAWMSGLKVVVDLEPRPRQRADATTDTPGPTAIIQPN